MRNMMLQVKNFKIIALCSLFLVALMGCKGRNEPEQTKTIAGNVSKPSWTAPSDYDMTSSMTALVEVDLSLSFKADQLAGWKLSKDDLLAAFDGNTCLGVAMVKDGQFFLYITSPQEGNSVSLKYYSASVKNSFTATESVPYQNNSKLGSPADPYMPKWTVSSSL